MGGECGAQVFAVIVVARHQIKRHLQAGQQFGQMRVLAGAPKIREIPSEDHSIRVLRHPHQGVQRGREIGRRIESAVRELSWLANMGVAHLRQQSIHGATTAPSMPCRLRLAATNPLNFISLTN